MPMEILLNDHRPYTYRNANFSKSFNSFFSNSPLPSEMINENDFMQDNIDTLHSTVSGYTDSSSALITGVKYLSIFSTVMNLLNSLLGAGVLGVANSFTFCGFIPSVLTITVVAYLSFVSAWMVIKLQIKTGEESFASMAKLTMGRFGSFLLIFATMMFCYACDTAYVIIGANTVQTWINMFLPEESTIKGGTWKYMLVVVIYSCCVPLALTFLKNMRFLSSFSTLSVVALGVFVGALIIKGIIILPTDGISPTASIGSISISFFNALAVYSLTFSLSVIVLPIIKPMSPDLKKRTITLSIAFVLCYLIVLIPSVIGYLIFGKEVNPILLDSFPATDLMITVVRVAFFIIINASYPVMSLTLADIFSKLFYSEESSLKLPFCKRFSVIFAINILPLCFALFLPNVRPALSIGGAFGGCLCNFIFPPMIWFRLSKEKWYHWSNILCLIFAGFGVLSIVIATYQSVVDAIHEFQKL
ncbi:Transmembrane amino acid transporter protein [Tritrichomonas foetus]|uniref:Transmembrane amino acid transporter protein n=1 Tax=Tritrichomonas foetus TaxID=1144522 RepID=A0A1J4KPK0_9EUKA|nr:Transmembrane amino acid transporter protein [Tritrichomonas foetus]|eukprot:OHT12832.1 Transmembrane amino acid transporter protein [Tritrichomonas foetus]